MIRKIQKVAVNKSNFADITYEELPTGEETKGASYTRIGKDVIHDDFLNVMRELNIHLATKCKQGAFTEYEDKPDMLDEFKTTQVSVGGEEEHRGVTLTGQRELGSNEVLNLNTPFIKFNPIHSTYSYSEILMEITDRLFAEADAYINGKIAPSNQLGLFDSPEEKAEKENHAKRPKGRSRKIKEAEPGIEDEGMAVAV